MAFTPVTFQWRLISLLAKKKKFLMCGVFHIKKLALLCTSEKCRQIRIKFVPLIKTVKVNYWLFFF